MQRQNSSHCYCEERVLSRKSERAKQSGKAGTHGAVRVLADQCLSPSDISKYLIPTRVQFEDWGTWEGDVAESSGSTSSTSLTSYRTRRGEVLSPISID